jgi:hypothetical protein
MVTAAPRLEPSSFPSLLIRSSPPGGRIPVGQPRPDTHNPVVATTLLVRASVFLNETDIRETPLGQGFPGQVLVGYAVRAARSERLNGKKEAR